MQLFLPGRRLGAQPLSPLGSLDDRIFSGVESVHDSLQVDGFVLQILVQFPCPAIELCVVQLTHSARRYTLHHGIALAAHRGNRIFQLLDLLLQEFDVAFAIAQEIGRRGHIDEVAERSQRLQRAHREKKVSVVWASRGGLEISVDRPREVRVVEREGVGVILHQQRAARKRLRNGRPELIQIELVEMVGIRSLMRARFRVIRGVGRGNQQTRLRDASRGALRPATWLPVREVFDDFKRRDQVEGRVVERQRRGGTRNEIANEDAGSARVRTRWPRERDRFPSPTPQHRQERPCRSRCRILYPMPPD